MDGYFAGPGVEPRRIVDAEGWLETGDLGELDGEGSLRVHARRTDLIVTGGENVYPVDVEQRLERLPGVLQALVFGVADDRWGQVVAAALVLAEGASLEDIAEASRIELAPHKRPRLACRVAALPLTSSGKVQRANVADRYARDLHPFAPARRVG
jgi:O-succinylbenzoic acid--CoA ligase